MRLCLILLILIFSLPVFAQDIIQTAGNTYYGRIGAGSDGLFKMNINGVEQSFVRAKNSDYFADYIKYKSSVFSSNTVEIPCRIIFVDFYSVTVKNQTGNLIKIPRYRIKQIILNTY